jgi:hypothetical protein
VVEFFFFLPKVNKHYGIAMGKGRSIDDFKMKSLEIESTPTIRICKIDFSTHTHTLSLSPQLGSLIYNSTKILLGLVYTISLFVNMPIG